MIQFYLMFKMKFNIKSIVLSTDNNQNKMILANCMFIISIEQQEPEKK